MKSQKVLRQLMDQFCAAPRVVFEASEPIIERGNFTSWYNALALRDYKNPAVNDLYYLHEISHIATMDYSGDYSFDAWKAKLFLNELEASVLSEAYIYFLAPGLRELSFQDEIWVDRYLRAKPHPTLEQVLQVLLDDRTRIQMKPNPADHQELRIADYQIQNEEWARVWRSRYSIVEAHMSEFLRQCRRNRETTGRRHLEWLHHQITLSGRPYPFGDEVDAFHEFSRQAHKGDLKSQAATELKPRSA